MRARAWAWYLVATLAATGLLLLVQRPGATFALVHLLINLSLVGALVIGIRVHRPVPRGPWVALLVGYGLVGLAGLARHFGSPQPGPVAGDPVPAALYLAAYLAIGAAMLLLVRGRGIQGDRRSLTDALVAVGGGALLWFELLLSPALGRPGTTAEEVLAAVSYPVPDLVFLVALLWVTFARGSLTPSLVLLTAGIVAQAFGDALLGVSDVGLVATGGLEEACWPLSQALVGAAALHPSMSRLGAPSAGASWLPAGRRVYLMAGVSLLVAILFLAHEIESGSLEDAVFAGSTVLLLLLVFARLRRLMLELEAANRHLQGRERELGALLASSAAIVVRGRGLQAPDSVSPSVERVLGFTEQEAMAPGFWRDRLPPDDREDVERALEEAMAGETGEVALEHRLIDRDGRARWMSTVIHRDLGEDGTPMVIGTSFDITARRQAERDLVQAKEDAETANRAKSAFLSSASHELRTPLNSVLGFAQLLERSTLSPEDRDSVQQVLRGGRTLLAMVDSVLELARVESGRLTLSIEPVPVDDLVTEAADLVRPMAAERRIRLVTPAAGEAAPWVLADPRRLKQVLLNLLSNGITHNHEGGSLHIAWQALDADRVRLSVTDTGPGIAPERQATLFTIFDRRGEPGRKAGLGVGLALSARLVEAMGGTIGVLSEPGAGSTFTVELPRAHPPSVELPDREGPAGIEAGRGATLVYIEDSLANLRLVERILAARPGTRVVAAMQGGLGRELVHQHQPDLVLLDLHLPDMPGEELLRQLRADPATREIPVIVLSSALGNGSGQRILALGAAAYLSKPLDVGQFLATVDCVLGREVAHA